MNKIVMYCTAVGVGYLYYRWEKYQPSINSWIRPSDRAVNVTSPKLIYRAIKEEDEGIYHCVVSSDHNTAVVSDNATLSVYGRFSVLLHYILHKTIYEVCFFIFMYM